MKRIALVLVAAAIAVAAGPIISHARMEIAPLNASQRFVWQRALPQGNPLVASDFVTGNLGWVIGGNGTVIKTADGGFSWDQQGPIVEQGASDQGSDLYDVSFVDATHGWVAGDAHLYQTQDGGDTWASVGWSHDGTDYITYTAVDFADVNNGWFIGNHQVWHTSNGGSTVATQALPAEEALSDIQAASNSQAFVIGVFAGYFATSDGGETWDAKTYTGTAHEDHVTDAIAVANGSTFYVATGGDVLRTGNGGSTWTTMTVGNNPGDPVVDVLCVDGSALQALAVTESGEMYSTSDGGTTPWSYFASIAGQATHFDAPATGSVYAIIDSTLMASSGGSFGSRSYGTGASYDAVDFTSETTGYAVGGYDYSETKDGGSSWEDRLITDGVIYAQDIHFLGSDPSVGWIVGDPLEGGPSVLKTTDGGASWISLTETDMAAQRVCFADAQRGFATNNTWGSFWRTTDGGDSWTEVEHDGFHGDVDFVDANNGWIAFSTLDDEALYVAHTTDGGSTWVTQTVAPETGGGISEIDFVDANNGYAIDSFSNLFKTTNGGATWSEVPVTPYLATFDISDIAFSTKDDGWIVGVQYTSSLLASPRHGFAAHTTDGGLTWDYMANPAAADGGSTGSAVSIRAVDAVGSNAWLVGSGAILKTRPQGAVTLTSGSTTLSSYGARGTVNGRLTFNGLGLGQRRVELWTSSSSSGFAKSSLTATTATDGSFSFSVKPSSATYYKVRSTGDDAHRGSELSTAVKITPRAYVQNPIAPSTMYRTRYYTVYGKLMPQHTAGSYPVRIYRDRYVKGAWRRYGTYVKAKARSYPGYTKYSASVKLPYAGRWRLRAYAPADTGHAATWSSGYDYVTVR